MRFSMDVIGYGGYFTQPGKRLSLEESIKRAARFGYDAACIYAHRLLGFPMDLDLEMGAVVCCTNFLRGDQELRCL